MIMVSLFWSTSKYTFLAVTDRVFVRGRCVPSRDVSAVRVEKRWFRRICCSLLAGLGAVCERAHPLMLDNSTGEKKAAAPGGCVRDGDGRFFSFEFRVAPGQSPNA